MSDIKILSAAAKRTFDTVPKLSTNERIGFITLDKEARKTVGALKTPENKVGYILQRAYFQAKGRFFDTAQFKKIDKRIAEKAIGLTSPCDLSKYSRTTASRHKKLILQSYKWRAYSDSDHYLLKAHALLQVDKQSSGEDILFSLLDFCWLNKTEIPSYAQLVDIISGSYAEYESSMLARLEENITEEQKTILFSLLNEQTIVKRFSDLKKIDQSTSQKKLNQNAKLLKLFRDVFVTIKPLIDELHLSADAIRHFSDWIYKSDISQINQLTDSSKLCLRLAAFVKDQFYLRQDYSVDAFLKIMRGTINKAKGYDRSEKERLENEILETNQSVLDSAKNSHQIIKLIIEISTNASFTLSERNQKVIHLAESFFEAEDPNLVSNFQRMGENIKNNNLKINFHQYLFAQSNSLQKSLSPFIRNLMFDTKNSNKHLIEAIKYFSEFSDVLDKNTPVDFLAEKDLNVVFHENDIPNISKYKIILFSYIEQAIRNRTLTLEYSYRYKTYRSYMIPDDEWKRDKLELVETANLTKYLDGPKVLKEMGFSLTKTYEQVNKNYLANKNDYLTIGKGGKWRFKPYEADFDSSKYIPGLLSKSKFKLLYELLSEIDTYADFTDKFSHTFNQNTNSEKDKKLIYATLMSLGTNLGHNNLAKASKAISNKQLRDTDKYWFSGKNVENANRKIVEFIQSLPLPTIFNAKDDVIHTSNDGKKIIVAVNSLLANYSYKYYGKEQGINVNSFLDEKQTFFHVNVLTSSDREAPYMMDGIVKTKANLFREGEKDHKHHKHSSDTHGYTEAIFAGLHFLNVSFAPRIAKLADQIIYAFESKTTKKNSSDPIAPNSTIRKKMILNNWDDILRLMTTIKLGRCSASQLFKILSSTKKDNELYAAIKELGRLIKSKFILNYVDDESLRRSIQKQLNRAELGQKLSEKVFFGRKGKLHVGTPEEIQKVMSCKTLLKNAIILWNYLFLSDFYHGLKNRKEKEFVLECIASGSVISWEHINMHGLYDFDQAFISSFKATIREMKSLKIYK